MRPNTVSVRGFRFRGMPLAGLGDASIDAQAMVESWYLKYLHRLPEPAGMTFWAGLLTDGSHTVAQVEAGIANSDEAQKVAAADALAAAAAAKAAPATPAVNLLTTLPAPGSSTSLTSIPWYYWALGGLAVFMLMRNR